MFAALYIPGFILQCRLRFELQGLKPEAILVEDISKNSCVIEANQRARNRQITPGIRLIQALSRYSKVRIFVRCPHAEKTTRQLLQRLCLSLTPQTEETRSGLYLMDLNGIPSLCTQAITRQLLAQIDSLGLSAKIAFASNADLAELASQSTQRSVEIVKHRRQFLKTCPVDKATQDKELLQVLDLWGIQTLDAFTKLPIEAITDRFGENGRQLWERVMGRQRRLLRVKLEDPIFREAIELEYSLHTLEPLLFIIRRFIDSLCQQLQYAHLLAAQLTLRLFLENETIWEKAIELPEPIRIANTLFSVLEKSLESAQTEHAIIGIELNIDPIEPTTQQRQIFETAIKNPWRFADTVDRLAALVGEENVGTPFELDSHKPDSVALQPLDYNLAELQVGEPEPEPYGPPMRRYRPPLPIQVGLKQGRPSYLKSAQLKGRIIDLRGPFEISGDWWDQQFWKQTEWDVQLENKQLYRITQTDDGWHLEGIYG